MDGKVAEPGHASLGNARESPSGHGRDVLRRLPDDLEAADDCILYDFGCKERVPAPNGGTIDAIDPLEDVGQPGSIAHRGTASNST